MANRRKSKKHTPDFPKTSKPIEVASAGKYTMIGENGQIEKGLAALTQAAVTRQVKAMDKMAEGYGGVGGVGGANIADSDNIGYYSYQFPVDALEQPQSRSEELQFYRLAYTRDPIVHHAINLHSEIPCSKMRLERPKCSVEAFSDYVYDYFQRLVNDTRLFQTVIDATREYQLIGESFLFVQQPENFGKLKLSKITAEAIMKGRGYQAGTSPLTEGDNGVDQEKQILPDFITQRRKKKGNSFLSLTGSFELPISSQPKVTPSFLENKHKEATTRLRKVAANLQIEFAELGLEPEQDTEDTLHSKIVIGKLKLAKLKKATEQELHKKALLKKLAKTAGITKLAQDPPAEPAPAADAPATDAPADTDAPDTGGDADLFGGGDTGGGGFGGGGMDGGLPEDQQGEAQETITNAEDAKRAREINELRQTVHLLERKKSLLEELEALKEEQALEKEIFSHLTNNEYEGFERIMLLQPERVSVTNPTGDKPEISYRPSDSEKEAHLADPEVTQDVRDALESNGQLTLNNNAFEGSYVMHFARKMSGYEVHGRSCLQACMRTIIYREKLRQVQTTLASRNMTPKTIISAPGITALEVVQLRAHADEAKADPDYTIVVNYEVNWNEIDSSSRLLQLDGEWQHTNSDLAIGLGFSPEILIGEGMYGNSRVHLELMTNTYTQYRETLCDIIENQIFKPIAMLRGFYEMDNYDRPRWVFPKITFGSMALKDSGDVFEIMYNLYSKGSLPISNIYELLGLDTETVTKELENDLFSVRDSKMNELLSSIYGSLGSELGNKTDVLKKIAKNLSLNETEPAGESLEGSGEGL